LDDIAKLLWNPDAMHGTGTADVLVFLIAAVMFAPLFRRLRFSQVLGYLAAGALIGPFGLGLVADVEGTRHLAEFGVVFLLFAIGLELSFERLRIMRRLVFGLGTAQVLVTGIALAGIAVAVGLDLPAAIVIGGTLALSSTAFVVQLLQERGEFATHHGRAAFATLLFQDLAVVPLLVIVPLLNAPSEGAIAFSLVIAVLKAIVALVVIVLIGRLLLRPLYRLMASVGSREIFTALTLLVVLGIGSATQMAGLSMALGAFLAGLLISESEFRHQVEADIEPFRAILLGLFFMTVGMSVNLGLAFDHFDTVLLLIGGLIAVKMLVLFGLSMLFRQGVLASLRIAALLCQGGEFAFVIFGVAIGAGVLDTLTVQVLFLVVSVSMALTPVVMLIVDRLTRRMDNSHLEELGPDECGTLENHVIIAGYGRFGRIIARLLEAQGVTVVMLDMDAANVAENRANGRPVYYGDAARPDILRLVGAEKATGIVLTLDRHKHLTGLVGQIREDFPNLTIFARSPDAQTTRELEAAGAYVAVPELLEASLQLGAEVLAKIGVPETEIESLVDAFRHVDSGRRRTARSDAQSDAGEALEPESERPVDPVVAACEALDRVDELRLVEPPADDEKRAVA